MMDKPTSKQNSLNWARNAMLNKPGFHSVAAISVEISYEKGDYCTGVYGSLHLSDCSRVISIDLDATARSGKLEKLLLEIDNTQHKLDTLISVLTEAKKFFNKAKERAIDDCNNLPRPKDDEEAGLQTRGVGTGTG